MDNHPQNHFWAHRWPWEQEGRDKSRKKKQRNKTHPPLRNSCTQITQMLSNYFKTKQNPLKLSLVGQQANKPARKRGLLHRLELVCWFFHTLQPQLARQIYQLARQTWVTYTNNINLFAPPNTLDRLHFSFRTSGLMYHPQHSPHSHAPRDTELKAPSLRHRRHFTFRHSPHLCGSPLLRHWPPYFHSPSRLHPASVTSMPPSPSYPRTQPACQIPSGSPAGSCQALGPSPWPSPSCGCSLKATSAAQPSPSHLLAPQPCFLCYPQCFCFFQKYLHLLLSLKPVRSLHD